MMKSGGLPHSEITGSTLACSSPVRIVARHVLPRHWFPEHPPYALSSLTILTVRPRAAMRDCLTSQGILFGAQGGHSCECSPLCSFIDLLDGRIVRRCVCCVLYSQYSGRTFARPSHVHYSIITVQSLSKVWWRCTGSNRGPPACKAGALPAELHPPISLVGTPGLEPGTSALSGLRSNQLSYAPICDVMTFTTQQCSDPRHNLTGLVSFIGFLRLGLPPVGDRPRRPWERSLRIIHGCLRRKEVIQPHLPIRLPCYDLAPIADTTFAASPPCGLGQRLRVEPTLIA